MPPRASTPHLSESTEKEDRLWAGFRRYPSHREGRIPFIKTATSWIEGKRLDDDCGAYWRVRDSLYDLTEWIERHPGGREWIQVTRGTDITEVFFSSHVGPMAEKLLAKYRVRDISTPRNSPYTLDEDGFYMTLRRNVHNYLKEHPLKFRGQSMAIQNGLLVAFVGTFMATAYYQWPLMAALCGFFLFMNVNCAHNFFHLRDTWRMHVWDLSLLSSYEWRITHALSHHIFTNTINDFELSGFEPFVDFKVYNDKNVVQRRMMFILIQPMFPLFFVGEFFRRIVTIAAGYQRLRWENLLPLVELVLLGVASSNWVQALVLFALIQGTASYFFALIGLTAAHHHPDMFHCGDDHRYGRDWGLCQLDAVGERHDTDHNLLTSLTTYGNHALHHLFPTFDHDQLDHIDHVFRDTCRTFGITAFETRQGFDTFNYLSGAVAQLARVSPRKIE